MSDVLWTKCRLIYIQRLLFKDYFKKAPPLPPQNRAGGFFDLKFLAKEERVHHSRKALKFSEERAKNDKQAHSHENKIYSQHSLKLGQMFRVFSYKRKLRTKKAQGIEEKG